MKIAFISENLDISFGGPAQSIPSLLSGLRSHVSELELFIVKNKRAPFKNPLLDKLGLSFQVYNVDLGFKIDYCRIFGRKLTAFIEEDEDAIVHVNNLWRWAPYKALKIAQSMGRRTVFSPRGMLLDEAFSRGGILKNLVWKLFFEALVEKVDCIHVTSRAEAIGLRNKGLSAPIAVIPHGIAPYTAVSAEKKTLAKENLKLCGDRDYILFLSRITEHKGLHLLIEAFGNLGDCANKFDILVAGEYENSGYKSIIQSIIVERNLTDRVKFIGEVSGKKKEASYCAASFFVLPSRSENFGIVIGEALSFGLPVVTTHGSPWAVLSERSIGAWIPRKIKDIERQLKYFCSLSPAEYEAFQPIISNTISSYSWGESSQKMFELYSWLSTGKSRPDFIVS